MKPPLVTVVLLAALAGCDRSGPVAPSSPTPPASSPGATAPITSVAVRGNTVLSAIGETTRLTATASLSDGTTLDVTTAAQWISSNASAISVSPMGVLTVMRFGQSYVYATYQNKSSTLNVRATSPGTFVVWGRVGEPGTSGLAGVQVRETSSGVSTLSDANGEFSLGGLTSARIAFEKDGYERAVLQAKPDSFVDAAMQRVIRIAAGTSVEVDLAPHDVSYQLSGGSWCYPCKMIRIVHTQAGRLQLNTRWSEPRAALTLWVNSRLFEGATGRSELRVEVGIDAPGELLVYVGMRNAADYDAPFILTTEVVK